MKTIIYSSVSAAVPDAETLHDILAVARAQNARHGVRGILLVASGCAPQIVQKLQRAGVAERAGVFEFAGTMEQAAATARQALGTPAAGAEPGRG